jgi:hypothetical protein
MRKGKTIGLCLGAVLATASACSLIEPIPPFQYEEALLLDASDERDDVDFGRDALSESSSAPDTPAWDAAGSDGFPNPCPDPGETCCGWTPEAGSGSLYCDGVPCQFNPEWACITCLSLDCDASAQFCCLPGGDNKPVCRPFGSKCN